MNVKIIKKVLFLLSRCLMKRKTVIAINNAVIEKGKNGKNLNAVIPAIKEIVNFIIACLLFNIIHSLKFPAGIRY